MNCQMIRVISSPSSSTTGPSTLIFATAHDSFDAPVPVPAAYPPGLRARRGASGRIGDGAGQPGAARQAGQLRLVEALLHLPGDGLGALRTAVGHGRDVEVGGR